MLLANAAVTDSGGLKNSTGSESSDGNMQRAFRHSEMPCSWCILAFIKGQLTSKSGLFGCGVHIPRKARTHCQAAPRQHRYLNFSGKQDPG